MWTDIGLVALGLVCLVVGGEGLLRGAVGLARKLGISPAVIGLTIVGFGTSAPELVVGVQSALAGAPVLSMANSVGSNIANVLLIIGAGAVIAPLGADPSSVRRDSLVMLLVTLVAALLSFAGVVHASVGLVMLVALVGYVYLSYVLDRRRGDPAGELHQREVPVGDGIPTRPVAIGLFLAIGLVGLSLGASWLVSGASDIARAFGVPESVIGLTLVAVGTSLPELVATVVAAIRGHADVAVGNVLGSNIFNLLGILGVSSLITPIPFSADIAQVDVWVMLGAALLFAGLLLRRGRIERGEGIAFVAMYAGYMVVLYQRVAGGG